MIIRIHSHARQRMRERGASAAEVRRTVASGSSRPAKFGRTVFERTASFNSRWNGKHYSTKRIEAIAAKIPGGWMVVTVLVKYF